MTTTTPLKAQGSGLKRKETVIGEVPSSLPTVSEGQQLQDIITKKVTQAKAMLVKEERKVGTKKGSDATSIIESNTKRLGAPLVLGRP